MAERKVLVTGGAGFVGSNLIEALVRDPQNQVYSLDNYFTGKKDNHIPGATYLEGSTVEIAKFVDFRPDLVYHLGEYSRVEQSFSDLSIVMDFNRLGTSKVFEFCLDNKTKLVYAGSSTKFGDGGEGKNQSPYAWTKASNTELVGNLGRWYDLDYAVTYFYNVYGPREIADGKYATLIALFKEKFRHGEPLTVVSPGTQRRNFTYVGDIVDGLLKVGEKGQGDNFGLGNPDDFTVLEIAQMFGGEVTMLPERPGNRMGASIDISKSVALGWKPRISVKDHIQEFIESLKTPVLSG